MRNKTKLNINGFIFIVNKKRLKKEVKKARDIFDLLYKLAVN